MFVPVEKWAEVLQMNHDHVLAGQLSKDRNFQRIRRQFSWPGMYADVAKYDRGCSEKPSVLPKNRKVKGDGMKQ